MVPKWCQIGCLMAQGTCVWCGFWPLSCWEAESGQTPRHSLVPFWLLWLLLGTVGAPWSQKMPKWRLFVPISVLNCLKLSLIVPRCSAGASIWVHSGFFFLLISIGRYPGGAPGCLHGAPPCLYSFCAEGLTATFRGRFRLGPI